MLSSTCARRRCLQWGPMSTREEDVPTSAARSRPVPVADLVVPALAVAVFAIGAWAWWSGSLPVLWVAVALQLLVILAASWRIWGGRESAESGRRYRAARDRLEALCDDTYLLRTDRHGRLRQVRPPWVGADPGSIPPLGSSVAQCWAADDHATQEALAVLWREDQPIGRTRVHRKDADDGRRWALRAQPVMDESGRFQGHEIALSAWSDPLPAGTAENEADRFVYSVSHDLRAPLRTLRGFSEILREDLDGRLDASASSHLGRIEDAAARMDGMIDALLALSRLSSQPMDRRGVDLSGLAQGVLDELRQAHPDRQVDARIEEGLQAEGDPVLLRMVLQNLLGNAWKYTARRPQARIEFGASADAGRGARFYVRDNGAGFDMRYADKLFAPFQRLHSAKDYEGTGVGLASARRIIQRHGGRLWAEAAVDEGACFYFTLP